MTWVWLNGNWLQEQEAVLSFRDLAIQRGYGVFDFFRLKEGIPIFLDAHLDRFYLSAQRMHLQVPVSREAIALLISDLISKNKMREGGVRLTLTGGNSADGFQTGSPTLVLSSHTYTPVDHDGFQTGIRLMTWPHQRQLPEIKTIDYVMAIWLQPVLKEQHADDVLYHRDGLISECPRSNFFLVMPDERVITPEDHVLRGITREQVLRMLIPEVRIQQRQVFLEDLLSATAAFVTSTTKSILPVRQVDDHIFPIPAHPLIVRIKEMLDQQVSLVSSASFPG